MFCFNIWERRLYYQYIYKYFSPLRGRQGGRFAGGRGGTWRKMAGRDNGLNMLLLALLYPKGIVALLTSRNINEVARARFSRLLRSSRFAILGKAQDAQSPPQGAHDEGSFFRSIGGKFR